MLNQPISITAISSISALGQSLEEVWESYTSDAHYLTEKEIGDKEYWASEFPEPLKGAIHALRNSDSKYRGLDDTVLYAIYAARKAVEITGWREASTFGINLGSSRGATGLFEKHHTEFLEAKRTATSTSPSTTLGNIASWVAHDLKSKGPTISHSITCSTALHAMLNGIAWLQSGLTDKFLVGASEAPLTPFTLAQMQALKVYVPLSPHTQVSTSLNLQDDVVTERSRSHQVEQTNTEVSTPLNLQDDVVTERSRSHQVEENNEMNTKVSTSLNPQDDKVTKRSRIHQMEENNEMRTRVSTPLNSQDDAVAERSRSHQVKEHNEMRTRVSTPLNPQDDVVAERSRSHNKEDNQNYPCQALNLKKDKNTMVLGEAAAMACLEVGNADKALAKIIGIGYATEPLVHGASISADAMSFQNSMKMAMEGCSIDEVDVVVMHAPGTIKGDLSEYKAIEKVFEKTMPLVTTNKWKVGHTFATSGMLSVEMAVLMLQKQQFIPVPYFVQKPTSLPIKKVLVNAVGFGGNAVSILISK